MSQIKQKKDLIGTIILSVVFVSGLLLFTNTLLKFISNYKIQTPEFGGNIWASLFGAITTIIAFGVSKLFADKRPLPLYIALLGFPKSGKTVFLTVLFRQLMTGKSKIPFIPYGSETSEKVSTDYGTLEKHKWLPQTQTITVFPYRALVIKSNKFFKFIKTKYKVDFSDFAGEWTEKFIEEKREEEKWLHKSQYFDFVVQSDVVFLTIDSCKLLSFEAHNAIDMQNSYITALQVLIEKKGVTFPRKLNTPIAIIFMKSDIYKDTQFKPREQFKDLIDFCETHCNNYDVFEVSSIGLNNYLDNGPKSIEPINITTPIEWALGKIIKVDSKIIDRDSITDVKNRSID